MIKVAFCDDEPVILEQITALLEKYKEQRCRDMEYAAFRSPLELLAEMENGLHPDVLLLDVIMPGESGISAAREIRQFDNDVKIIFSHPPPSLPCSPTPWGRTTTSSSPSGRRRSFS